MSAQKDITRPQNDQPHHREDYRASRSRVEDDVRDSDRRGFQPSVSTRERPAESRALPRDSPPRQPPPRDRNAERIHRDPPTSEMIHHGASLPVEAATADSVLDHIPNVPVPNPSKIYIGGLPELTRPEDLEDCFSQLGRIKNIELKTGYGFVEYDSSQAACDAVAKYHEGTFLGSQIKVELSHGGSRPRHIAVSNNPEACYTCGIIGHWARDCPAAESQLYSKRRLRDRSVTPPRHRENPYMSRDPRHDLEVSPHEHRHHRRRSPLGEIDYTRTERDRLPLSARESYFLPAHAEDKRFRPDHSFRGDRERDDQRALDLKILPRGEEYRAPYLIPSSRSRSPPPGSRDYYTRHPAPYPVRSLPRNDYQGRVHELKSYAPEPAYYRDHVRAPEPPRLGRYEDRSPDRQQYAYPLERIVEPTRIDRRYEVPEARVITRGHSPRRARSPRRSPSPSRRPPTHRRPLGRSPPPYESAGYGRPTSYPIRR
ncbi:hypothetical protein MJO28_005516 [Puccinia striiformis f. sp. tritici]|uniref:Uncharacterized protein n=1 Tax=Puccinia striiformis f. sp. tritici TaxID=168172 RepID=A0ACC0EMH4_9BASI|nr:hypothetical protein MJO28_005516 [Puccinia striiformis f. sp. tritici]